MSLGKQGDGKERSREHDCERQSHQENRKNCAYADVELDGTSIGSVAGIEGMKFLRAPEGNGHGSDREGGGYQSGSQDEKKLSEHEMHARNGAGENRFHRAALFFPCREIDGRMHGTLEATEDNEVAEESADDDNANFFVRGYIFMLDIDRVENTHG